MHRLTIAEVAVALAWIWVGLVFVAAIGWMMVYLAEEWHRLVADYERWRRRPR